MAECIDCGQEVTFFQRVGGRCSECHRANLKLTYGSAPNAADAEQEETDRQIDEILLTTEVTSDLKILERIDIITAECAYGMNVFKDLFAGVRDIVGGRSEAMQKTMRDARNTVLFELRREAYEIGANAVVGVDLDYVELSGAGNMVMLVASGTAVRIAPADLGAVDS